MKTIFGVCGLIAVLMVLGCGSSEEPARESNPVLSQVCRKTNRQD